MWDAHCHATDPQAYKQAKKAGVQGWLWAGTDPANWETAPSEALHAFGVHPWKVAEHGRAWTEDALEQLKSRPPGNAIGEIGLDFGRPDRELQEWALHEQLKLAQHLDLPVVLHSYRSHERLLKILQQYNTRGLLHAFRGPPEPYREMGYLLSLGVNARTVPKDGLLIETDTRPLTSLPQVAAEIALRLKRPTHELVAQTTHNLKALLRIP